MLIRTKHITAAFSLSLLLIPSIYGMENLEIEDFDFFFQKHEEIFQKELPNFSEMDFTNFKQSEECETAKAIFNHPPNLASFLNAVKATAKINDNSPDELILEVNKYWSADKLYLYDDVYYNPQIEDLVQRSSLPTLVQALLEGIIELEQAPSTQACLTMLEKWYNDGKLKAL